MIERQVIVSWFTPEEKLPPEGEGVVVTVNGRVRRTTYENALTMAYYYKEDGWFFEDDYLNTKEAEIAVKAWCDIDPYKG